MNQVSAFLQSPELQKAWMYLSHEVTYIQLKDNADSNGIYLMRCSGNNEGSGIISHMFISSDATMTCCFDCQSEILRVHDSLVYFFTCKNKDNPSVFPILLHSAVIRRFCITVCLSDGLASYYMMLESLWLNPTWVAEWLRYDAWVGVRLPY